MQGIKRIGFYFVLNALVLTMISIVLAVLGIRWEDASGLLLMCAIFGFAGSLISLLISKPMVKAAYKIKLVDGNNPDSRARFLYETVTAMARERGLKPPEVGIYPSKDVNAFATGASRNSSLVAFSSGMLDILTEDELAAVAGHEMTHISEGDMVSMTLVMGLVNTFVMFLARIVAALIDSAMRGDRGRGGLGYFGYYMVVILLQNVLMLLAMIPVSYYSRYREYRADRGAALFTGAGNMIAALQKIDRYYAPDRKQDSLALAKINNKQKMSLYATHPPIGERIERLRNM
jgi:heat shock protein HtpX